MKDYTCIMVCPKTGEQVTERNVYFNHGVCVHCGHVKDSSISHYMKVVGRWVHPSLIDRIFHGKKSYFVDKDHE